MSGGALVLRVAIAVFLCWTLYKMGRTVYHFFHRRSLRQNGYTVKGTVVHITTVVHKTRTGAMVKIKCRVRYTANNAQTYETTFIGSYLQASLPRLGDVTDVYVNPANPADAEADHYATPPNADA